MIKFKQPLVAIIWHDAATDHGWEPNDIVDTSDDLMITVGFLIAKGENNIVIASSIDEGSGGMSNSRIKIPIGMVRSIKELNASYKKEKKVKEEPTEEQLEIVFEAEPT